MFGIKHKGTDTLRSEPSYASRGLAVFKNSEHVVLDAAVEGKQQYLLQDPEVRWELDNPPSTIEILKAPISERERRS